VSQGEGGERGIPVDFLPIRVHLEIFRSRVVSASFSFSFFPFLFFSFSFLFFFFVLFKFSAGIECLNSGNEASNYTPSTRMSLTIAD